MNEYRLKQYLKSTECDNVNVKTIKTLGRLHAAEAAMVLGFEERDIPVLVSRGLLEPLGEPPTQNCRKYFAAVIILTLAENPKWLNEASKEIYGYWKGKNSRKTANLLVNEKSVREKSFSE